ncbi:MAG: DUF4440 domain-containing protein [Ignavibacteriales bacterium]|nr:DUF4440 domain-containing protein [Ignavibacteriales bacterium]
MEPKLTTAPEHMEVLKVLSELEIKLHQPVTGMTMTELENMMEVDFWEIGASGRSYRRDYVLNVLEDRLHKPAAENWESTDFHCQEIAPNTFLLTYAIKQWERITRRSSIWHNTVSGWKCIFHQGTVVLS